MRYRIEYADGRCCNFANSRKDLLDWLKLLKDEKIVDIRKIYMVVVRIIVKIVLLPVRICLTMIQLVVMFFTWLSATVFHILSGIICITAVLGYGFGQETGTEAVRMLVAGFILYILPVLSGWAVVWLETFKIRLME